MQTYINQPQNINQDIIILSNKLLGKQNIYWENKYIVSTTRYGHYLSESKCLS